MTLLICRPASRQDRLNTSSYPSRQAARHASRMVVIATYDELPTIQTATPVQDVLAAGAVIVLC
jgi:hypothetical protein